MAPYPKRSRPEAGVWIPPGGRVAALGFEAAGSGEW